MLLPSTSPISSLRLVRLGSRATVYVHYFLYFQGNESLNTAHQSFFQGHSVSFNSLVITTDFNEWATFDMQSKHLILSLWLQENTRLLPTTNMTLLQWSLNYSVYIVFYSKDDGGTYLTEKEAWWSQILMLVRPAWWNCLHSWYSKSSGSQAPSVKSDQVKICSSSAAYKNMLHIPQRLITVLQNWRTASAMYIPDKEPKMISENQSINPTTSLLPTSPFQKNILSFSKTQLGLSMVETAILESRIPQPFLLLLARDDSHPYGSSLFLRTFLSSLS